MVTLFLTLYLIIIMHINPGPRQSFYGILLALGQPPDGSSAVSPQFAADGPPLSLLFDAGDAVTFAAPTLAAARRDWTG